MSIIKSNGSDLLSSKADTILSIPNLNRMELESPHHDMFDRELKLYDWVLIVSSSGERIIKRIGTVIKFTDKKVTVLSRDGWLGNQVEKTSVYSDKLLKIDLDSFKHLINYSK